MGRFAWFVTGFILGAVCVVGSLKYHVLQSEEGFDVVPKTAATLEDTYVDIRGFTVSDWSEHKALALAITQSGKTHLFRDSAVDSLFDGVGGFLDQVRNPGDDGAVR